MPLTLFISDLHLDPARPAIVEQFRRFCERYGPRAEAVYILGDFVEYWLGDDDREHGLDTALDALHDLASNGPPVYLMHGNRDFLMGRRFADAYGLELIPDPTLIDLYGTPTLLMHGDTLCTDDLEYQNFRRMVRDPDWQSAFLQKDLAERRQMVTGLRETSRQAQSEKDTEIMDVNSHEVEKTLREHGVRRLIHGHTHRPAVHELEIDGEPARRIVLGDWYEQGNVLIVTPDGFELRHTDFSDAL